MTALTVVTSSFPGATEGAEAAGSFVADFCLELAAHAQLTVVAPGERAGREDWHGLTVRRFAAPSGKPLSQLKPARPGDALAIARLMRSGQAATHAAVAMGADAVLALWALPCGWWARRSARAHGVPYGVWCLGSDIWVYGRKRLTRPLVRGVLTGAARRWADGLALAREVEALAGAACAFLPSSRRLPALAPALRDAPPYRLTFIGRWHPNKGTDLLMEALALLGDADWQRIAQVQIHGGGPLDESVRAAGARLAAAGRPVQVSGFIGKDEAAQVLAATDWLLIPSRIESIPVVFSDALAAGTPVIATPVGDLPELLGGHAVGVCARDTTAAGIAAAIREAIGGVPGAHAAALAGLARDFDIRRSAAEVLRDLPGRQPA